MTGNLFAAIRRALPADLGRTFLERPDGSALSYADMLDQSGRVAQALRGLGVRPGDRVAAPVVTARPGADLDEGRMVAALAGDLARYKLPKRIVVAEALPRNAMAKVQKNELRELYRASFVGS